jgi:hypothetical protein
MARRGQGQAQFGRRVGVKIVLPQTAR